MPGMDKKKVVDLLNQIMEMELAGVVRYTHYSFMVYGYGRIPIVSWLRSQANESLLHAQEAGELITQPLDSKHFRFEQYQDAYEFIDRQGAESMKVFIDLDG